MKFIDIAKISIRSGNGGNGAVTFRREKYVPKGGPDGGNGGRGGDVIFIAEPQMNTLLDFKYKQKYSAQDGGKGMYKKMTGKDGESITIKVPCGTLIKDAETDEIIADLTEFYQQYVVCRGGDGGKGNFEFRTATNQTPRYATPGWPGEEREVVLELKLIADVGIVGLPNVGKSTLISTISAAKPKIADYHFTTLVPNLGIVKIDFLKSYTVADIPGLIEGASEGKGLGIQFLRHVERTRVLLFMLDAQSVDPKNDYKVLVKELKKFNPSMLKKEQIICISKVDSIDNSTKKELAKLRFTTKKLKPVMLSAVSHENIEVIKFLLWEKIQLIDKK